MMDMQITREVVDARFVKFTLAPDKTGVAVTVTLDVSEVAGRARNTAEALEHLLSRAANTLITDLIYDAVQEMKAGDES